MIHLDTSFLIRALEAGSVESRRLETWLEAREPIAMSCVAWTEFLCGPAESEDVHTAISSLVQLIPFGEAEAATAASLFNSTGRRRGSQVDCMIAATCIRAGARLATSNQSDFDRLEAHGLRLAG